MEIVKTIEFYSIYNWTLINNYLKETNNDFNRKSLTNLLEQNSMLFAKCFNILNGVCVNIFNNKLNKSIKQNLRDNNSLSISELDYLAELKSALEQYFINNIDPVRDAQAVNSRLTLINEFIEKLLLSNHLENSKNYLNLLDEISCKLIKKYSELTEFNWAYYLIFLYLDRCYECLKPSSAMDNEIPELNYFLDLYKNFTNTALFPATFILNEDNFCIDHSGFPNKFHHEVFNLLNLDINYVNKQYNMILIGKNFIKNNCLFHIFAHEFGHLIDNNVIQLSDILTNQFINSYPDINSEIIINWLREIIADSFAICMTGPLYYESIVKINNLEQSGSSISHPGILYRSQILYSYLYNNGFLEIRSDDWNKKYNLRAITENFDEDIRLNETNYYELQNVINTKITIIYDDITKFLVNSGYYYSSSRLKNLLLNKFFDKPNELMDFIDRLNIKSLKEITK